MADLSDLQAAQTVKIAGANTSGVETNYQNVDSFGTAQSGLYSSGGAAITSASNGTAGNQNLHVQTPDTITSSTALGALNATISISTTGLASAGFQISSGTLIGTIIPESSLDGGTTWAQTQFFDPTNTTTVSSVIFTSANTTRVLGIVPLGGSSNVRVRVSAYTSGTANAILRASQVIPVNSTTSPLPTTSSKFSFGDVTTAATTLAAVSRTAYIEQTTNAQRSIASSSVNDTSAGTGARTVQITYLDQTGAGPFTENVTLNGTAFVNTTNTNICFIESIKVLTVGSTGSNVGILTFKAATAGGGATIGTIAATDNQTLWAHHYVPSGKSSYISGFSINSNGTTTGSGANFVLRASTPTIANTPELQISDFHRLYGQQSSTNTRTYLSPIQVAGPARIRAYVTPETATSTIYRASFDYIDN